MPQLRFPDGRSTGSAAGFCAATASALAAVIAIVVHFYDRFWWPPDEGVYAYVAQRMLAGDRINLDLQDLHAGYVNFLHAAALWLFGEDLLSLRYILAAATVLQGILVWCLLLPTGFMVAAAGAIAMTSLSFVQFLNPSANWYALALAVATTGVLTWWPAKRPGRIVAVGALLGLTFLFRQLSGVMLAMGVLYWMLNESAGAPGRVPRIARLLMLIMALGLAGYLWSKTSITGLILFGAWPLALLLHGMVRVRMPDGDVWRLLTGLAAGALLAALPLILYHLAQDSLVAWSVDLIITPLGLLGLEFMRQEGYAHILLLAIFGAPEGGGVAARITAAFWLVLLLLPPSLGMAVLASAVRGDTGPAWRPLPVIAVFFALVSTHFQMPIYLFFSIGFVVVAAASLTPGWRGASTVVLLLSISIVALITQAAQPVSRGLAGIVAGTRVALDAPEGLPGASIAMERADQRLYEDILAEIAQRTSAADRILALPMNPEFYFLGQRRPPVRFYVSALGIHGPGAARAVAATLEATPPRLVIHQREDKYNTRETLELVAWISERYRLLRSIGPFDLYVPLEDAAQAPR